MLTRLSVLLLAVFLICFLPLDTFSSHPKSLHSEKTLANAFSSNINEIHWHNYDIRFLNFNQTYSMTASSLSTFGCEFGHNAAVPNVNLFVFVPTRPDAFDRRVKIRESWAASNITETYGIVVKFVVGESTDPLVRELLLSELRTVGDLIINNLTDTYDNLHLKIFSAFQWQQKFCSNANFVLKTDDDTVVELERLIYWIRHEFAKVAADHPSSIFGGLWHDAFIFRNKSHKWYVPWDVYGNATFPPYVNGATYLLTGRAVGDIVNTAGSVKLFNIEDSLLTGVVAEAANILRHDASLHFRKESVNSTIAEGEKCDSRNVPYVVSFYGFPENEYMNAFSDLHNTNCTNLFKQLRL